MLHPVLEIAIGLEELVSDVVKDGVLGITMISWSPKY